MVLRNYHKPKCFGYVNWSILYNDKSMWNVVMIIISTSSLPTALDLLGSAIAICGMATGWPHCDHAPPSHAQGHPRAQKGTGTSSLPRGPHLGLYLDRRHRARQVRQAIWI